MNLDLHPDTIEAMVQGNARYSVLAWEPMMGSGERLNVGALAQFGHETHARLLIRPEALNCMYGKETGADALHMIRMVLQGAHDVAEECGFEAAQESLIVDGFEMLETIGTWAPDMEGLFRQIVQMNCSLGEFEAPILVRPTPIPDWARMVKRLVTARHPTWSKYFEKATPVTPGGTDVTFGFLADHLAVHFGSVTASPASLRQARARLWELDLLATHQKLATGLIVHPGPRGIDDAQKRHVEELAQESNLKKVLFRYATSAEEAAQQMIDFV